MSRQPCGPTKPLTMVEDTSAISRGGIRNMVEISGGDVAVDVAHRAFVFVVGGGTDAADDEIGVGFTGVIDQKAVFKHADADVGEGVGNGIEHGAAFFYGVGAALFWIGADGDDEFVKEGLGFLYHPQVAEGRRVEAACVHGTARSGRGHFGLGMGFVWRSG